MTHIHSSSMASAQRTTSRDGSESSSATVEFGELTAKRQNTKGQIPTTELSVPRYKEAFARAAPDGLLDVALVNSITRHFRLNITVQELEDRVNAVAMNGRLLVLSEFLSVMAEKKTVTEGEFIHVEEADRCSAASNVQQIAIARVASALADYRMYGQNAREQLCFKCLCDQPPSSRCPPWCQGRIGGAASAPAALRRARV